MDDGTDRGVSDLKLLNSIPKKLIILCMIGFLFTACFGLFCLPASAAGNASGEIPDIAELLDDVEERVSDALSKIEKEEMDEIFDFVKEKVSDGSLYSEEGIKAAIAEAEEKFNVSVDASVAQQVVDAMEKLEDMGFSGEEIVNKAEKLYDTYGADFLKHANEMFAETIEEAVENAVADFFSNLWEDIKTSVSNLFKSWF